MKKLIEALDHRYKVRILGLTDRKPDSDCETIATSPEKAMTNIVYRYVKDRKQAWHRMMHLRMHPSEWKAEKLS